MRSGHQYNIQKNLAPDALIQHVSRKFLCKSYLISGGKFSSWAGKCPPGISTLLLMKGDFQIGFPAFSAQSAGDDFGVVEDQEIAGR